MTAIKVTKISLLTRVRGLIAGTQKHPPSGPLTLGGTSFTEATLVQALQGLSDALAQVDAAKANWKDALTRLSGVKATALPLLRAYEGWVIATSGNAPALLADYGMTPRKVPVPLTSDQSVVAATKRAATRAARHTMGSKQKKAVKGPVTGVVMTPIPATAPSATTTVSPSAPAASPGATAPAPHAS